MTTDELADHAQMVAPVATSDLEAILAVQEEIEVLNDKTAAAILELESKAAEERAPLYLRRGGLISRLPRFWLTVFKLDPFIAPMLKKMDVSVLGHASSFELVTFPGARGFKFVLKLAEGNPYFPVRCPAAWRLLLLVSARGGSLIAASSLWGPSLPHRGLRAPPF